MPLNKKSDKPKGFSVFSGPLNILNELSKLNGIDFNGKQLVVYNAATKSPAKSNEFSKNVNRRSSPVINKRSSCYEIFQSSSSN